MSDFISLFDLFSVGIGPSSSHSVGPMKAARDFKASLTDRFSTAAESIEVHLYGSLALTGVGHGTDRAIVLGLLGQSPESVDPDRIDDLLADVERAGGIFAGKHLIRFNRSENIRFHKREQLDFHPNGMVFRALDSAGNALLEKTCFSIGGGFVVDPNQPDQNTDNGPIPFPFDTGNQLLDLARKNELPISQLVLENEKCFLEESRIRERILFLWQVMQECVERGCRKSGVLPGGLKVERRAARLLQALTERQARNLDDPLQVLDWVDLYALAVNEENAAGGRVVTAPTNGAAGILPAVMLYYRNFCSGATNDGIIRFFLTAAAIAKLYKKNASISGAEVGCQGEVGVACSMAAGALAEVLGGSPEQVEQAAEIGMEHNLGLTCDPIGGLVQVPCIERNAMGAVKAINAARLALRGNGQHRVSLDKVIATMRRTGNDMSAKYKETSRGGLALINLGVNVIEC